MPRGHVKLRREAFLRLGSHMVIGVDLLRVRAAKQALEKYEGGCGSGTHITGEPFNMFIGTRALSSSVSST